MPLPNLAGIFAPQPVPACRDAAAEVQRALSAPLGLAQPAELARAGERVLILVDDHTRATPVAQILPPILTGLHDAGVPERDITILITHGTHRLSTAAEVQHKLGADVAARYRVVQHDCTDESAQAYVGLTSRGTPVWVNRLVLEADRRIGIGDIGPSPYAGYSGGGKLILPGVAALDTVNANHSLVAAAFRRPGHVDVPCRQDIDEAAALVRLDLVIDVVLNQEEAIVQAFAGAAEAVFQAGLPLARQINEVACPAALDIAITSGAPYDIDLYQAVRAVEYADTAVRPGGAILLVASCPDGAGGEDFRRLMMASRPSDDYLRAVVRRSGAVTFSVLGYFLSRIKAEKRLYILCDGIPPRELEAMGFQCVPSLQAGVDALLAAYGPQARVGVFPLGSATIPQL